MSVPDMTWQAVQLCQYRTWPSGRYCSSYVSTGHGLAGSTSLAFVSASCATSNPGSTMPELSPAHREPHAYPTSEARRSSHA
eukprot:291070-Rhodomonas_salina.5